jgi:hypothetical protein
MGNPKSEPWFSDQWEDTGEDARFVEVTEQIDRLSRNADFERGRLLRQMRDENILGRWASFEDCVWGRFKITKERAYQLIRAADVLDLLESRSCQLPNNERQIRNLSSLKKDDLKVLAWMRACQQKRHGSPPDYKDVAREVRRLLGSLGAKTPNDDSDAGSRAYRKLLESAQARLKKAHRLLETGDLDGFIVADDKATKRQKARLLALLGKLAAGLRWDALILQGEEVEEEPHREITVRSSPLPDLLSFRHYGEVAALPVPAY